MGREDAKLLERVFFAFCQKIKDGKVRWQTVRDALMKYIIFFLINVIISKPLIVNVIAILEL
jgi:hypothetical protein